MTEENKTTAEETAEEVKETQREPILRRIFG